MSPIQFLFELFYHVKQKSASAKGLKNMRGKQQQNRGYKYKNFFLQNIVRKEKERCFIFHI